MLRGLWILPVALMLWLEPALANKFTTIGGGVAGASSEKLRILKELSLIFGAVLAGIGVLGLLTFNRFDGIIGLGAGKRVMHSAIGLILAGAVLVVVSLV